MDLVPLDLNKENDGRLKWYGGICIAQVIAILSSIGGAATQGLGSQYNLPMTQTVFQYVLLFLVNGIILLVNQRSLVNKWYKYVGMAAMDTTATYCTIAAFSYTSVTSWSILTPSGLIICIPLTYYILKARYKLMHYLGIGLAFLGMVALVLFDNADDGAGSNPLWGDFLVIVGSVIYSVNSIWMEKVLKENAPVAELLAMMGGFGIVFSTLGAALLGEFENSLAPTTEVGLLRGLAILAVFAFYMGYPVALAWSGTTILQLSLLGTTFWSIPARIIFFNGFEAKWWWVFALAAVMAAGGLVMYTFAGNVYGHAVNYEVLDQMGSEDDPIKPSESPSANLTMEMQMAEEESRNG